MLATLVACSTRPQTGFLVVVSSQMPIDSFEVRVANAVTGHPYFCSRVRVATSAPAPSGAVVLPATLGIEPSGDPTEATGIRVTALAFTDDSTPPCEDSKVIPRSLVRSEAVVNYVKDSVVELPLPFTLACIRDTCSGTETCRGGKCEPLELDARRLKKSDGNVDGPACYAVRDCTDAVALERLSDDTFRVPATFGGRPIAAFSPFVAYRVDDPPLSGVEFLTSPADYAFDDAGRVLTLQNGMANLARLGVIEAMGAALPCPAFADSPFCSLDAPKVEELTRPVLNPPTGDGGADASLDATLGADASDAASDAGVDGGDATVADSGSDGESDSGPQDDAGADAGDSGDAGGGMGPFETCTTPECCGTCTSSTNCTVEALAQNEDILSTSPPQVVAASRYVFWVAENGKKLRRRDIVAGSTVDSSSLVGTNSVYFAIAANDTTLAVAERNIDGFATFKTYALTNLGTPSGAKRIQDYTYERLAIGTSNLYSLRRQNGVWYVDEIDIAGDVVRGNLFPMSDSTSEYPTGLVASGRRVFAALKNDAFATGKMILVDFAANAVTPLLMPNASPGENPLALAVNDQYLWVWVDEPGSSGMFASVTSSVIPSTYMAYPGGGNSVSSAAFFVRPASTDAYLAWSMKTASIGVIDSAAAGASALESPVRLATGQFNPTSVTATGACVYWANRPTSGQFSVLGTKAIHARPP
ncbi:MAG: hypothetical protein U0169_17450 [Polyangiaceae bacterium]